MNRQVVDLGLVLSQFPKFEFSVDDFDGRLRLQKFIYLMQSFGIYLGYDFSWYLRGPYCTTLAACGFALREIYDDIPENVRLRFESDKVQREFERFAKSITKHESNEEFLEIAASMHYLRKTCTLTNDEIIEKVAKKQPDFTEKRCREIWKEMEKWNLL